MSSVPLSLATVRGVFRVEMILSSFRATRLPANEVSATSPRHSRLKSSTTQRMRKRRPSIDASETKTSDQRWFGPSGISIGARVPKAGLRPLRHLTASPYSRYSHNSFFLFITMPSSCNKNPISESQDGGVQWQVHGVVDGSKHHRLVPIDTVPCCVPHQECYTPCISQA